MILASFIFLALWTWLVIAIERNQARQQVETEVRSIHAQWRHFLSPNSLDHIAPDGKTLTDPDARLHATFTRKRRVKSVRFGEAA